MVEESRIERMPDEIDTLKAKVAQIEKETSDLTIAKAIQGLTEAIRQQGAKDERVTLTVGTPSSGGELVIRFEPKAPMTDFMQYLGTIMEKQEEVVKAKQELASKYGLVKGAK